MYAYMIKLQFNPKQYPQIVNPHDKSVTAVCFSFILTISMQP